MKLYRKLNLPKIPLELLPTDVVNNKFYTCTYYAEKFDYGKDHCHNGELVTPPEYSNYNTTDEQLITWLHNNIPYSIGKISFVIANNSNNGRMIVHTDRARRIALNYLIDTGGDNVVTNWYRETNHPLIRPLKTKGQTSTGYVRYKDLILQESLVCNKDSWYMLRTDVLHDVENINGPRIYLSINFEHEELLEE